MKGCIGRYQELWNGQSFEDKVAEADRSNAVNNAHLVEEQMLLCLLIVLMPMQQQLAIERSTSKDAKWQFAWAKRMPRTNRKQTGKKRF